MSELCDVCFKSQDTVSVVYSSGQSDNKQHVKYDDIAICRHQECHGRQTSVPLGLYSHLRIPTLPPRRRQR